MGYVEVMVEYFWVMWRVMWRWWWNTFGLCGGGGGILFWVMWSDVEAVVEYLWVIWRWWRNTILVMWRWWWNTFGLCGG